MVSFQGMQLKNLRKIFQIIAFGVFIFQMHQAIMKYVSKPIVTEKSSEATTNIQKPLIYVCQDNQFNYSRARELGYLGQTYFLVGEVNGSDTTSWLGNSTNQTYEDIQKDLFNGNITDHVVVNADIKPIFIQPYGFCNQVLNFSIEDNQQIHSHLTVRVLILDPYRSTHLRNVP